MNTQVFFDNLSDIIVNKIYTAKKSIHIAIAWFTHKDIWEALVAQSNNGVGVYLLLLEDRINSELNTEIYTKHFTFFNWVSQENKMLHHKYCVVDYFEVITGSYNWSYKGNTNYENILVVNGDVTLCSKYVSEWEKIALTVGFSTEFQHETIQLATLDYQISSIETEKVFIEKQINDYLYLNQEQIEPLIETLLKRKTHLADLKFKNNIIDIGEKAMQESQYKEYQRHQEGKSKIDEMFNISDEEEKC